MKKKLYTRFSSCRKEEELKSEFCKAFKVKLNAVRGIDHYSEKVLFEFKYDKNFKSEGNGVARNNVAAVLAQTMYYIRWLKYGKSMLRVPPNICCINKNEAFFVETKDFKRFFTSDSPSYDWDRAPSTPCPHLVKSISKSPLLDHIQVYDLSCPNDEEVFYNMCHDLLWGQIDLFSGYKKKSINEENFWEVFEYWNGKIGKYVVNGHKASEYFLADIEETESIKLTDGQINFHLGDVWVQKAIPPKVYDEFWQMYDKVPTAEMTAIRQKSDRIAEEFRRRFNGGFYTPIDFAQKGLEYLNATLGEEWWKKGEYRFWDMAAGTGNLEFNLPTSALQYCYISTILEDEANYCKKIYPTATCFKYDYLNDDTSYTNDELHFSYSKIPQKLKEDLQNPAIKWIIFINPPFKTANDAEKKLGKKSTKSVSKTALQKDMAKKGYGAASRELFVQFLYRIGLEFQNKSAFLCMFSKLKYLNSHNDQAVRDGFFQYGFRRGFMFPSSCFHGTKGNFPVGFLIWDLETQTHLKDQTIRLDVFDENVGKIGKKLIPSVNSGKMLNKWCNRYRWGGRLVMPMFSSAFQQQVNNKDKRDHIADGFLFSLSSPADDIQHQELVSILSAPHANAGAFSVTSGNFERAMVLFSVKNLPEAKWTNDRDSFYAPSTALPQDFINDCVVYAAFHEKNYSTSLRNVSYKRSSYQINNNLFPFKLADVKDWPCTYRDFVRQLTVQNEDRFLAQWLSEKTLSEEASNVVAAAKKLYKKFYANIDHTKWIDYKVESWDVGLCQILRSVDNMNVADNEVKNLKEALVKLRTKLRPKVYEYGFLNPDVEYFPQS